ncbi:alkene reductase [Limibacter armeniacum]|uniref:alkene reductase n=1 Tax=Limibacter armeniacum TaxID=466084 RepID=UPI002FE553E2
MKTDQPLLQPIKVGPYTLKNRVFMAPLTRSRADNEGLVPTELHQIYYKQRASAGLIISEGSPISPQGIGYINTPGIYTPEQINGWKKVTDTVHEEGGRIFIQLWHVGRISHPDLQDGKLPVAPSAINPNTKSFTQEGFKETVTPRALETEEVAQIVQDFKKAAENAMKAGFDGVEIHAANGYLLHQFFSKNANQRTDKYGGSVENRARILFEVLDAISEVMDSNKVGVRLNPSLNDIFSIFADDETIEVFEYIVKKLNEYDLAYLHLTEPFNDVSNEPKVIKHTAKHFRPLYKGTFVTNAGFDKNKGNKVIEDGDVDAVAFGTLFISNPDLPKRFELDAPLQKADPDTFYVPGAKGYIDYPTLEEVENKHI